MLKLLYAHWLKTKRTSVRAMLVCLPVLYGLIMFGYYTISHNESSNVEQEYMNFFLFLGLAIQFISCIVIVLVSQLDKKAGNFGNELAVGVSRIKMLCSKVTVFLLLLGFVALLATVTFMSLQGIFRGHWLALSQLSLYLFYIILLTIPLLLVYIWTAYQFDMTGTLTAGILFLLVGILMGTTNLGGDLWIWVPPTWMPRAVFGLIPARTLLTGATQKAATDLLLKLVPITLLLSISLFLLLIIWYNRWEGTRHLED